MIRACQCFSGVPLRTLHHRRPWPRSLTLIPTYRALHIAATASTRAPASSTGTRELGLRVCLRQHECQYLKFSVSYQIVSYTGIIDAHDCDPSPSSERATKCGTKRHEEVGGHGPRRDTVDRHPTLVAWLLPRLSGPLGVRRNGKGSDCTPWARRIESCSVVRS